MLNGQKRAHGVDLQRPFKRGVRLFRNGHELSKNACIGKVHVEPSELGDARIDGRLGSFGFAHVHFDRQGLAGELVVDLLGRLLGGLKVDVSHHDALGALLNELFAGGRADAASASRDHAALVLQTHRNVGGLVVVVVVMGVSWSCELFMSPLVPPGSTPPLVNKRYTNIIAYYHSLSLTAYFLNKNTPSPCESHKIGK